MIIVDLDNTLAASAWREALIDTEGWDAYHAASTHDKPHQRIVDIINVLATKWPIICITERPEKWRAATLHWLHTHGVAVEEVLMRPEDNWQPATELKLALAKPMLNAVHCVINDSDAVLDAFRALGIPTLQVTP